MLGNLSTEQLVIELPNITIMAGNCKKKKLKRNTEKPRRAMDGQTWRGLKLIALGLTLKTSARPLSSFTQIV